MNVNSDIAKRMKPGWHEGLPYTPCGRGSTAEYTLAVRLIIPKICAMYNIKTVNDIGAGDLKWMDTIPGWDAIVDYKAYDIIPRDDRVTELDITLERPRDCDLTICRDVLIHLNNTEVLLALANIRQSSRFALISTYTMQRNVDLRKQTFRKVDLTKGPYYMDDPIFTINEVKANHYCGLWNFDAGRGAPLETRRENAK